jgi:hypothetical protein
MSGVSVKTKHDTSSPCAIVELAVKYVQGDRLRGIEANAYDQVWAIFDWDERTDEVMKAVQYAERCGVRVALSNPCFDVWLIWHLEDFTRVGCLATKGQGNTDMELKKVWPSYRKGMDNQWDDLINGITRASQRANAADDNHRRCNRTFPENRPSSQVVRLMEEIESKRR